MKERGDLHLAGTRSKSGDNASVGKPPYLRRESGHSSKRGVSTARGVAAASEEEARSGKVPCRRGSIKVVGSVSNECRDGTTRRLTRRRKDSYSSRPFQPRSAKERNEAQKSAER